MLEAEETVAKQTSIVALERAVPAHRRIAGCVLLSARIDRGEWLREEAAAAGWEACVADEPLRARRLVIEQRPGLLVVDLESESGVVSPALEELVEQVSRRRELLIVLCGNEDNQNEETWARRLGVWLYLPGVSEEYEFRHSLQAAAAVVERKYVSQVRH